MSKCINCRYQNECDDNCVYEMESFNGIAKLEYDAVSEYEAIWEKEDSRRDKDVRMGKATKAFNKNRRLEC